MKGARWAGTTCPRPAIDVLLDARTDIHLGKLHAHDVADADPKRAENRAAQVREPVVEPGEVVDPGPLSVAEDKDNGFDAGLELAHVLLACKWAFCVPYRSLGETGRGTGTRRRNSHQ